MFFVDAEDLLVTSGCKDIRSRLLHAVVRGSRCDGLLAYVLTVDYLCWVESLKMRAGARRIYLSKMAPKMPRAFQTDRYYIRYYCCIPLYATSATLSRLALQGVMSYGRLDTRRFGAPVILVLK